MLIRLGITAATLAIAAAAQEAALDRFEKKIRPVLAERCYACPEIVMLPSKHPPDISQARLGPTSGALATPEHHSRDVRSVPVSPGGEFTPSRLTTDANLIIWA
jgi:hypothetical protein